MAFKLSGLILNDVSEGLTRDGYHKQAVKEIIKAIKQKIKRDGKAIKQKIKLRRSRV